MDISFYISITCFALANALASLAVFSVSVVVLKKSIGLSDDLISDDDNGPFLKNTTAQLLQVTVFTLVFMFSWMLRAGVGQG